ncbi:MAG: hypothetical protein HQL46_04695 [Gammaproteobacteria bacterium]|nr:hypothetical protein [Gammaproteobacteria bacterium]
MMADSNVKLNLRLDRLFSSSPGPHEYIFQKVYSNPLILDKAEISLDALSEAKTLDKKLNNQYNDEFVSLVDEISKLKPNVDFEIILKHKEQLENLYLQVCRLGGEKDVYKKSIITLINSMMKSLWQSGKDDDEALLKLRDEEIAREIHFNLLESRLIAEIISEQSCIEQEHLIPILLLESPGNVKSILSLFTIDQYAQIYESSLSLLNNLDINSLVLTQQTKQNITSNFDYIKSLVLQN